MLNQKPIKTIFFAKDKQKALEYTAFHLGARGIPKLAKNQIPHIQGWQTFELIQPKLPKGLHW